MRTIRRASSSSRSRRMTTLSFSKRSSFPNETLETRPSEVANGRSRSDRQDDQSQGREKNDVVYHLAPLREEEMSWSRVGIFHPCWDLQCAFGPGEPGCGPRAMPWRPLEQGLRLIISSAGGRILHEQANTTHSARCHTSQKAILSACS